MEILAVGLPFAVSCKPTDIEGTSIYIGRTPHDQVLLLVHTFLLSLTYMAANIPVMPESLRTLFSADSGKVSGRQVIVVSATTTIAFVISLALYRGANSLTHEHEDPAMAESCCSFLFASFKYSGTPTSWSEAPPRSYT